MSPRSIKNWQEFFIAASVVATLQMLVMQPPAEAAVDNLSMKSPIASISTLHVTPGTVAAGNVCVECKMPAPILDQIAGLVITTHLANGNYVAVWQNKYNNLVYGQCFSRDGKSICDAFHINAEVKDGILPVILGRGDGGFVAKWQQDGQGHEQYFNLPGMAVGNEAKPK